jgi:hypothetical protein
MLPKPVNMNLIFERAGPVPVPYRVVPTFVNALIFFSDVHIAKDKKPP